MLYSKYGSAFGGIVGDGSAIPAVELEVGLCTVAVVIACRMVGCSASLASKKTAKGCDIKVFDGIGCGTMVVRASDGAHPESPLSRELPGLLTVSGANGEIPGVAGKAAADSF